MPTYKITGPDGKVYRVTGENAEGAMKALQAHVKPDPRNSVMGKVDAAMRGAADVLSFGMADEIAAGGDALFNPVFGTGNDGESLSARYEKNLKQQRQTDAADAEDRGGYRLAGQIGGGIAGGAGLAKAGLSLGANAAAAKGASLGRVAAASAADGAILGAAQGAGSGEGAEGRMQGAMTGLASGLAIGGAAPVAIAGASKVLSPVIAPIASRMFPERYAQDAIGTALQRSGLTADDVAGQLQRAQVDGQDMFTVADAMGNAGQRMLSTVARTPHNERQAVIEALVDRQTGQGDRLASFLAEGFGAPDTALQRAASLKAARTASANANYSAARQGAGPVNLNEALSSIDDALKRDPILGDTALSQGPMGARLSALRDRLQKGGEQLIDFDSVLGIKTDLYRQMQRNPDVAGDFRDVYTKLDKALEQASPDYRLANDMFAKQSRVMDAVDTGAASASPRLRADDTIQTFGKMTPEEQAAFRAGYVDPMIAKVEAASMSPTTNKARPLMTSKTGAEFPAFALPDKAEQLGNRIAREQRMFETSSAAMGGSKTADNLADAADLAQFDPSLFGAFANGGVRGAVVHALANAVDGAKGMSPKVVERVAKALMETNPNVAKDILQGGLDKLSKSDRARAVVVNALINSGAAVPGRLSAP